MTQTAFESFAEEGIDPGFVTLRQLPSKGGSAYVITDWTIAVKIWWRASDDKPWYFRRPRRCRRWLVGWSKNFLNI